MTWWALTKLWRLLPFWWQKDQNLLKTSIFREKWSILKSEKPRVWRTSLLRLSTRESIHKNWSAVEMLTSSRTLPLKSFHINISKLLIEESEIYDFLISKIPFWRSLASLLRSLLVILALHRLMSAGAASTVHPKICIFKMTTTIQVVIMQSLHNSIL